MKVEFFYNVMSFPIIVSVDTQVIPLEMKFLNLKNI